MLLASMMREGQETGSDSVAVTMFDERLFGRIELLDTAGIRSSIATYVLEKKLPLPMRKTVICPVSTLVLSYSLTLQRVTGVGQFVAELQSSSPADGKKTKGNSIDKVDSIAALIPKPWIKKSFDWKVLERLTSSQRRRLARLEEENPSLPVTFFVPSVVRFLFRETVLSRKLLLQLALCNEHHDYVAIAIGMAKAIEYAEGLISGETPDVAGESYNKRYGTATYVLPVRVIQLIEEVRLKATVVLHFMCTLYQREDAS